MDSVAADCGAVDLIFRRTSFPPDELSAGPDEDYIGHIVWTGPSVHTQPVTGSLLFGHLHGLVYSRLCSTILSIYCLERVDLTQDRHCRTTVVRITADISCTRHTWCIEGCVIRSSIIVILIVILISLYCFGVFKVRAIASDGLPDGEQAGPSCAQLGPLPGTFLGPALDIQSESLYELAPDIPDVIELRALRPDAAAVKVMSVRNSWCIRVVTPDDHVTCGYHEILLHDMGEEELPFVSLSELDYLRCIWPRAVFAFMTRYQQDLNANERSARNVLVAPSQETVHIVVNIFRWIWASTLLFTTWKLRSCGVALLCGVRYGKGLLRTVLITCGVRTRCRYQSGEFGQVLSSMDSH